jgi:hypothetical protein
MERKMQKSLLATSLLATTWLFAWGSALAADSQSAQQKARIQQEVQIRQTERIYGSQLMSEQERTEHRSRMRAAKSAEALEQVRLEHHEKMKLRAEERGLTLPDEPPVSGGRGYCGAAGRPCGGLLLSEQRAAQSPRDGATGIAYVSIGIGDDDPVGKMSEDYNVHMMFVVQGSGEYLADIKVLIEDSKGKKVLEADSPGPIFYAKLPSGTYRITADYHGKSLHKSLSVKDRRLRDLPFRWRSEDIAAADKGRD